MSSDSDSEKTWVDTIVIVIAVAGLFARLALDVYPLTGKLIPISKLVVQYAKLFQGSAIFIVITSLPVWRKPLGRGFETTITKLAAASYPVYLVHEFFTQEIFTVFIPFQSWLQVLIAWLAIALFTLFFLKLNEVVS